MFYFFEYFDICSKAFANYFDHLLLSPLLISLSIILIGPIEVLSFGSSCHIDNFDQPDFQCYYFGLHVFASTSLSLS